MTKNKLEGYIAEYFGDIWDATIIPTPEMVDSAEERLGDDIARIVARVAAVIDDEEHEFLHRWEPRECEEEVTPW